VTGGQSRKKDVRVLIKAIRKLGCEVHNHQGHWKIYRDGSYLTTVPGTPTDHRALLNARSRLRRLGLDL
jgi:hypothetical protein